MGYVILNNRLGLTDSLYTQHAWYLGLDVRVHYCQTNPHEKWSFETSQMGIEWVTNETEKCVILHSKLWNDHRVYYGIIMRYWVLGVAVPLLSE